MNMKKTGEFLKKLRREKGLTQEQLVGIAAAGFTLLRALVHFSRRRREKYSKISIHKSVHPIMFEISRIVYYTGKRF
ncbi:MAG: hypothetical protein LIO67_09080 [Lachnospiraceae bacterium]|nr:hypothetical protein [Lachnospiraceae bacterium]